MLRIQHTELAGRVKVSGSSTTPPSEQRSSAGCSKNKPPMYYCTPQASLSSASRDALISAFSVIDRTSFALTCFKGYSIVHQVALVEERGGGGGVRVPGK